MGRDPQNKKVALRVLYFLVLCFGFTACKDDDSVKTYKAESDAPSASSTAYSPHDRGGALPSLTWNAAPQNWKTLKTSAGMQRATFSVTGKEGKGAPASATISVLDGQAGGVAANVNRWRGQVGLEPLEDAKVLAQAHRQKTTLGDMQWFDMANDKEKLAVLASIIDMNGATIFVKLMGPADIVEENKADFLALSTSLRYAAHDKQ